MKRFNISLSEVVGSLISLAACAAPPLAYGQTMTDALASAYENNPKLLAEREQLKATDEELPQALANWRPTIQGTAGTGWSRDQLFVGGQAISGGFVTQYPSTSYGVVVSENIYRGGRTIAEVGEADATIKSERAHLISVEQAVLLSAATDYLDVLLYRAALDLADEQVNTLQTQVESFLARKTGGEASALDLAQVRAATQQAMAQRVQAANRLTAAQVAYRQDVGESPGSLTLPTDQFDLPAERALAVDQAVSNNPDVLAAEFAETAAERNVDDMAGQLKPSLSFQGQLQHQEANISPKQTENVTSAIVQLKIPLYSGGQLSSQTRQARDQASVKRFQLRTAQDTAAGAAAAAWDNMKLNEDGVRFYSEQAQQNRIALTGTEMSRNAGERTELDWLNARQALYQAQQSVLQAKHDYLASAYALLAAIGRFNAADLQLPTRVYDPIRNYNRVRHRW